MPPSFSLPHASLASAGISADRHGFLVADTFSFRQTIERAVRAPSALAELMSALTEAWAEPDALRAALQPTRAAVSAAGGGAIGESVKDSLVRLLLQCDPVQTELAQMLLEQLPEHQEDLEAPPAQVSGMPLAKLVLSQFRWLERIVDGAALLETIESMLQASGRSWARRRVQTGCSPSPPQPPLSPPPTLPLCSAQVVDAPLRRELVLVMPDLVQDGQHPQAVRMLAELLREDSQFTAPVLDSLASLHLEDEMVTEMCELVTQSVASSRVGDLPAILRFLFHHLTAESAHTILSSIRNGLEVQPGKPADAAGEALVLDAIQSAIRLRSELAALFLAELEGIRKASEHRAVDVWLLTTVSTAADAKSKLKAQRLLIASSAKGLLTAPLLRCAIHGHGVALRPHYTALLQLGGAAVRSATNATGRALGGALYAHAFAEFKEPYERQELIGQLLTHVGSGEAAEVDAALHVLVDLAISSSAAISQFSSFLTGVLDHLDALSVPQARRRPLGLGGSARGFLRTVLP